MDKQQKLFVVWSNIRDLDLPVLFFEKITIIGKDDEFIDINSEEDAAKHSIRIVPFCLNEDDHAGAMQNLKMDQTGLFQYIEQKILLAERRGIEINRINCVLIPSHDPEENYLSCDIQIYHSLDVSTGCCRGVTMFSAIMGSLSVAFKELDICLNGARKEALENEFMQKGIEERAAICNAILQADITRASVHGMDIELDHKPAGQKK